MEPLSRRGLCRRRGGGEGRGGGRAIRPDALLLSGVFRAHDPRPRELGQTARRAARCAEDAGRAGTAVDRRQRFDVGNLPADQRAADAHGFRHHDGECRKGRIDRSEGSGTPHLPRPAHPEGEPDARHGAAQAQLYLRRRPDRGGADPLGMGRGLRRRGRGSGEDGLRQRHRRRDDDGGGAALRIRLRVDPRRMRGDARIPLRRAGRRDRGGRGADGRRRTDAARRTVPGQYRTFRNRLSGQGDQLGRGDDGRSGDGLRRLSGRRGGAPAGLYSRLPRHELRLRHRQGVPHGGRRGLHERALQPRGRRHPAFDRRDEGAHPPGAYLRAERRFLGGRRAGRKCEIHRECSE